MGGLCAMVLAMMTPLQIRMAVHYWSSTAPYAEHDPDHAGSLAVRNQREGLVEAGLLKHEGSGFRPTEALPVYIEALCRTPLPVLRWVIPGSESK